MYKLPFYSHQDCILHKTPTLHPESINRSVALLEAISKVDYLDIISKVKLVNKSILTLVHPSYYLDSLRVDTPSYLDSDTIVTKDSFYVAHLAVSALCDALDNITANNKYKFVAFRPPGHHAETDKAMGFCLLNSIAIAAKYAQQIGYKKVCIIDFDVHHGNGTQHIFETDPSVLYISSHQYPFYPGTGSVDEIGYGKGKHFTVNWPLPAGTTDETLLEVYSSRLPGLLNSFKPDIILVSAGYDIHKNDPLGQFNISTNAIGELIYILLKSSTPTPMIFSLEGGYNLNALCESVLETCNQIRSFVTTSK